MLNIKKYCYSFLLITVFLITSGVVCNPAHSDPASHNITASALTGGSISPSGTVKVNTGNVQAFTIIPGAGYSVLDVKADGSSVGAVTSYTFTNVTSDHTIEAAFKLNSDTIKVYTITTAAGTGGNISPSGIVKVNEGADQNFTIIPDTGHIVSDVKLDGSSIGAVTKYTLTNVTSDHTIGAAFKLNDDTATVNTYNAFNDFNISNGNPNDVWSYGKTVTLGGSFILFTDTQTTLVPGVQYWQSGSAYDPAVAKNITGSDIVIQWGWPFITWPGKDYLHLHPGPNGEFDVVRWTAPNSGFFRIKADYKALNTFPTRSDVYILHNNAKIFSGLINLSGHDGNENYSTELTIQSGDTIDFVVGLGGASFCANSTGLMATIQKLQ